MLYELRLEGERKWKWIYAFMEWDEAALESKGDSLMHFVSDPMDYKRGGQPTQMALGRVERSGFARLRVCPSSLCAPNLPAHLWLPGLRLLPQTSHHGCWVRAARGSQPVWGLRDSMGLFSSHPLDHLCEPQKSLGNLIWLHLPWFVSVSAGRKYQAIGKAVQGAPVHVSGTNTKSVSRLTPSFPRK